MLRTFRNIILPLLFICFCSEVYSQESHTKFCVDFRVNSSVCEQEYSDNAQQLLDIISFLQSIEQDSTVTLLRVSFCGSASPEGDRQINRKLARGRLKTLEDIVRKEINIPERIITRNETYISWEVLSNMVAESNIADKQAVLDIINQEHHEIGSPEEFTEDHRIEKLMALNDGKTWKQLNSLFFSDMRNAYVVFITFKSNKVESIDKDMLPVRTSAVTKSDISNNIYSIPKSKTQGDVPSRSLYLKTNAIGLGMAISNIGAEIDIAKHWSFAVPVYYSALNYFTSTVKFRTLAVQPEVRYWFKPNNQRLFIGAHLGYAQYNIATNGDIRYQDHNGKSPALGGGISIGYRIPISNNNRWHAEFTLGAGVYRLHYDTFYNVNDGKLIGTYKKTYWGIDNAAVNISYRFNLNKRK